MTIKYVVREGTVRGEGRWLAPSGWVSDRKQALLYAGPMSAGEDAIRRGSRIICVHVRKVPKKRRITNKQLKAAYEASLGKSGPLGSLRAALLALGIEVDE